MKFDNKGNTVPILEKLDRGLVGCLLTPNIIDSINYLIDVVTEQQKKIEFLNDWRIEHMDEHLNLKPTEEDIDKFVDYSIKKYKKTYKALGKSQEDVREKIEFILSAWVGGGYSRQMTISEITNKILAIVKGE